MKAHTKKSLNCVIVLISLNVAPISAQSQTLKKAETPPATMGAAVTAPSQTDNQQDAETIERLLKTSGQKYSRVGENVWVIRRKGQNLEFFQIVLYDRAGTLFTDVVVAKGKSLRLDEAAPTLLRLVNRLDSVKVGIDNSDDVFIRNEARLKSLDAEQLTANIESVARAADLTFLKLESFRKN